MRHDNITAAHVTDMGHHKYEHVHDTEAVNERQIFGPFVGGFHEKLLCVHFGVKVSEERGARVGEVCGRDYNKDKREKCEPGVGEAS